MATMAAISRGEGRVPSLFIESAFDAGVAYTDRLSGGGGDIAHSTHTASRAYAPLVSAPDLSTSPFQADLLCRCGAKNVDNACVSGAGSGATAPYERQTPAQAAWFSKLWQSEGTAPTLSPAELLLMARSGPQF